jgi:hypothetical protein
MLTTKGNQRLGTIGRVKLRHAAGCNLSEAKMED